MNENYDFFDIGQRYAEEGMQALQKKAKEFEKTVGKEARRAVEMGVISMIPQYARLYNGEKNLEGDVQHIHGTKDFGKENARNNSYFKGNGVGTQYTSAGKYNDPEKGPGRR